MTRDDLMALIAEAIRRDLHPLVDLERARSAADTVLRELKAADVRIHAPKRTPRDPNENEPA